MKSDESITVGPIIGLDYGKLKFYDWDGDGKYEAVIKTSAFFWNINYTPSIIVYKYTESEDGTPLLEIIYNK